MAAEHGETAVLKLKFARRGPVRVVSVLGGLLLLASPAIDSLLRSDGASTPLPSVVGAEMDQHHYDFGWMATKPRLRSECADAARSDDLQLRAACARAASSESCDHHCRASNQELAAHVSFDF